MKRIIALLTLTCALSVSSFAGEIPTCSSATGDVPILGADPAANTGNMPTGSSPVSSGDQPILTTVLLTLVRLTAR